MPRIFISYVHEDQKVAQATQRLIEHTVGVNAFLSSDRFQIFVGDILVEKIMASLAEAEVVVMMFSARSVSRPWVNFEAGAAWLSKKPILPCCYGNMNKDRLPHPYSGIQALNLRAESSYLMHSLCHHLNVDLIPARRSENPQFADERSWAFDAFTKALDEFQDDFSV